MIQQNKSVVHPFNSPIECGLRSLILLECAYPVEMDMQRLVFYDYLLVHSKDAGGPESIHAATPHRSSEVLVKRYILEQGLLLLMSRKLAERHYTAAGIVYQATDNATPFLDSLSSRYTELLKTSAVWVIQNFQTYSYLDLNQFFNVNLDRWGGEFEKEAVLKYVPL